MATQLYPNGQIPDSVLVTFGSGHNSTDGDWKWQLPSGTLRKHLALVARAKKRTGRTLAPSPGWSCNRPLRIQVIARNIYGLGAAWPGTSSHGGWWENQNTAAIDYGNWAWVYENHGGRAAFFEDCRAVGLTPGLINPSRNSTYPDEPWHVVDLHPDYDAPNPLKEDDLMSVETIYTKFNANQPIDKTASYIQHSGTEKYTSLLDLNEGDYLLPGGVLDIELEHPQPTKVTLPDGTVLPVPVKGTFQVQAHALTVDSAGKVIPGGDVALGIEEIIPTTGRTMRQIPLPPRRIGKGQRIRITISATDGLTGKIVSAEFRGSKVPKA